MNSAGGLTGLITLVSRYNFFFFVWSELSISTGCFFDRKEVCVCVGGGGYASEKKADGGDTKFYWGCKQLNKRNIKKRHPKKKKKKEKEKERKTGCEENGLRVTQVLLGCHV